MKRMRIVFILSAVLFYHLPAFLHAQTVIRILNGYVLFDSAGGMGKLGDVVEVQRTEGAENVMTGKIRLLLFRDNMASGKIVEEYESHPVRVGDAVRRAADAGPSVPKTAEPVRAAKSAPLKTDPAGVIHNGPKGTDPVKTVPGADEPVYAEKTIPKTAEPVRTVKTVPPRPAGQSAVSTAVIAKPDSAKTVLRVSQGYALVDPGKEIWKENSILRVLRKVNDGMLDVGDLRVVKRENGKLGAMILRENEPYRIAPGDTVSPLVQDFDIDTYFFGGYRTE